jgi:catechol 2,3-dioxygenase-like lactoylglutathione lyase family enzyme
MALKRMDKVGIVVDDLGETIDFFRELGLELEGRPTIEGEWAGRVTGLADQRVEIAMMRTPDGHSRLELSRFLTPCRRGSPQRPSERFRLPPRHVRRGRHRRDAWQASQTRRTARRRSSPVSGLISALLHPRA